ncbi:MAG: DUF493 family protein [Victivallaceae bacterium]
MNEPREIIFPVDWTFRIIVAADADCDGELRRVFAKFGMTPELAGGRNSSSGKYRTLIAPVRIDSRQTLDALPEMLAAVPGVKTVL